MNLHICGIDEINDFRDKGITHVLSLLDDGDYDSPSRDSLSVRVDRLFEVFDAHIQRIVLRFDDVTVPNFHYTAPTAEDVEAILAFGRTLIADEDRVLVHCHAGISRSTAAAALLLLQAYPEKPASEIFDMILEIRPIAYPNSLILELGGYALGRKTEILEALEQFMEKITSTDSQLFLSW